MKLLLDRQVGVERFVEKNQTVRFSTHGSARARTAVHFLLDRNTIHNIYLWHFVTFTAFPTYIHNSGEEKLLLVLHDNNRSIYLFKLYSNYSKNKNNLQKKGEVGTIFIYKHKTCSITKNIWFYRGYKLDPFGPKFNKHIILVIYTKCNFLHSKKDFTMPIQSGICGGLCLYQHLVIAFLLEARIILYTYIFVFIFPGNYWHLAHVKYLNWNISNLF